jgi:hypothetical protein
VERGLWMVGSRGWAIGVEEERGEREKNEDWEEG